MLQQLPSCTLFFLCEWERKYIQHLEVSLLVSSHNIFISNIDLSRTCWFSRNPYFGELDPLPKASQQDPTVCSHLHPSSWSQISRTNCLFPLSARTFFPQPSKENTPNVTLTSQTFCYINPPNSAYGTLILRTHCKTCCIPSSRFSINPPCQYGFHSDETHPSGHSTLELHYF